jgi:hypothetical protein
MSEPAEKAKDRESIFTMIFHIKEKGCTAIILKDVILTDMNLTIFLLMSLRISI